MKPLHLVAGFVARVNQTACPRDFLSRAQIRRIGLKFVSELYERLGADDVGRDSWLSSARETIVGASDWLFARQFTASFHPETYAVQLLVDVLKEVRELPVVSPELDGWCEALDIECELGAIAAILVEMFDAYPEIGDRYYVKVDIVKDLAAMAGPCKSQRRPGVGLIAAGYVR